MNKQTSGSGNRRRIGSGCLIVMVVGGMWTGARLLNTHAAVPQAPSALSVEGLPLGDEYPYRSPLAVRVSADGGLIVAIQHTGRRIDVVNTASKEIVRSIALPAAPTGAALDAARNRLFVTWGLEAGRIEAIAMDTGQVEFSLPAGHTPAAPVVSADGRTLFVCNRFDNEVIAVDVETRTVRARIKVAREPIAAALTPDDALLVVAHHLPDQAANGDLVAAKVDLVDAASMTLAASILLPGGSTGLREVCLSPDARYAYITHTLARFGAPTTQVERGWMNTSALSIIDLNKRDWLTTVLLDDVERGAANPWGVACSKDGRWLVVAHSGTHELSVIDRQALHEKIDRVAGNERVSEVSAGLKDIPDDLSFLAGLRRRVPLPGNGPRGVAMAGRAAVVAEYFSDSLAWVELDEDAAPTVKSIPLGKPAALSERRRGEIAFHDATLCFQQWQSCASCHPDARADALNWDLLNDGLGNPKNNRSMLHTHAAPPVMISGIRPNAESAVRAGFRFIQFAVVPEETAASVDAYLKTLRPIPSPFLDGGSLSASARRGKNVFEQAQCGACHGGFYYTNGKLYDIGLGPDERQILKFVTPTLSEVWRTAPYLYDGRAETIEEVLTTHNRKETHGRTSALSEQDIADLTAYVLSL